MIELCLMTGLQNNYITDSTNDINPIIVILDWFQT
jgi:hypothetical protein